MMVDAGKAVLLVSALIGLTGSTPANQASVASSRRQDRDAMEIDVGKILWQPRSGETKFFGKILKVLPPRIEGEGLEYQYARAIGTIGTKNQTLLVLYRFRKNPRHWQAALQKVGLPTGVPPLDFGTSYVWPATGTKSQPITFRGKFLNRVILAKDFSEITIHGHVPGTY